MALKGNLKDFSLTQLLNLVRLARKTGGLVIDEGSGPFQIYCQDGRLTGISAKGLQPDLAGELVRAGRLTEEQVKLVRPQLAVNTEKELALRLMDSGLVTREDVMEAMRRQTLEALFPAFTWTRGPFYFDPDARPADDAILLSIDLEAVILEGGRRIRETGRLQESIPSLDVVPRLAAQHDTGMRSINLSVDQWKVISFINGRNSLRQIADYTGLNEFQARKVMQEMVTAGLAELQTTSGQSRLGLFTRPKAAGSKAPSKGIIMRIIDRVRRL